MAHVGETKIFFFWTIKDAVGSCRNKHGKCSPNVNGVQIEQQSCLYKAAQISAKNIFEKSSSHDERGKSSKQHQYASYNVLRQSFVQKYSHWSPRVRKWIYVINELFFPKIFLIIFQKELWFKWTTKATLLKLLAPKFQSFSTTISVTQLAPPTLRACPEVYFSMQHTKWVLLRSKNGECWMEERLRSYSPRISPVDEFLRVGISPTMTLLFLTKVNFFVHMIIFFRNRIE